MSALSSQPSLHSFLARLVYAGATLPLEKVEQCDGCCRTFSLRHVELVGPQILCSDCIPSEFAATHLPEHPRLRCDRAGARL